MLQLLATTAVNATPLALRALNAGDAKASLAAADVTLLQEIDRLKPPGREPMASEPLVIDGQPHAYWHPSQLTENCAATPEERADSSASSPATRRAAEAVLEELNRYFMAQSRVRMPNARTVLGGRLVQWALDARARDPSVEGVRWWCEFLCRIEDARPFTKSNWASASSFEDSLSHCRLILVKLRCRLSSGDAGLAGLRDVIEHAHRTNRGMADKLLELLYMAFRPKPAMERCSFHELEHAAEMQDIQQDTFKAIEDQLILHILSLERTKVVDALAPAFLPGSSQDIAVDMSASTETIRRTIEETSALAEQLRTAWTRDASLPGSRILLASVAALGPQVAEEFIMLHGHYCMLAGLLERLELLLQAVQEYSRFVCFLPVHMAATLDLEVLLPKLQAQITASAGRISAAYESLPRAMAPPGRSAVLDKCRSLLQHVEYGVAPVTAALAALKSCHPKSTLQDFDGWRSEDQRWKQVARVEITAQALLPESEIEAWKVPRLVETLQGGGRGSLYLCDKAAAGTEEGCLSISLVASQPPVTGTLSALVDDDTRLYEFGRSIGLFSHQICTAAAPTCARLSDAVRLQLNGLFPASNGANSTARGTSIRAAGLIADFLGPGKDDTGMIEPKGSVICELREDGEWISVETNGAVS